MINRKEIITLVIVTFVLGAAISLLRSLTLFLYSSLSILIILLVNTAAKKIACNYFESEMEIKIWSIRRYGFRPHQKTNREIPVGAILPLILSAISFGYVTWLAPIVFDVKARVHRAVKRHGLYSFSEMTESHIGLVAAAGIFANLAFAILGYLIGLPGEMNFVNLSIWFAVFNMIPFADLDGNKIFFGNLVLWGFLAAIVLVGLAYTILLI